MHLIPAVEKGNSMLLSVNNLSTSFCLHNQTVQAVRNVGFSLKRGESLGIVGESGSGKTVLAHTLLRLIACPPGKIEGSAMFDGIDLVTCSENSLQTIRGNRITMIFQDPSASFNPYMRVADQLIEPLLLHKGVSRREATSAAVNALAATGIANAAERIRAYPHQFSGGMLQRAMIAMSVMMQPDIIIADEPTTALDVTVQAQLLQVMKRLVVDNGISTIFITHNLAIVNGFCDRIMVMYAGKVMEYGSATDIFYTPAHPYTRALLESVPRLDTKVPRLSVIDGSPPDPSSPLQGCPFHPRCTFSTSSCRTAPADLVATANDHATACVRYVKGEIA